MRKEIKLDQSTLPEDGQLCVFDTHEYDNIVGTFSQEEQSFFPLNNNPSLIISAFDVNFWEPVLTELKKGCGCDECKSDWPSDYNSRNTLETTHY